MQRILAPTDGSPHARKALAFATELAQKFDAEIVIIHAAPVVQPTEEDHRLVELEYASELSRRRERFESQIRSDLGLAPPTDLSVQAETASIVQDLVGERLLSASEEYVRKLGVTRVRTILAHGDPAKAILSAAEENRIDTIVIASRGMGEMRALLLGSVSNKIAHMAPCPVVLVR